MRALATEEHKELSNSLTALVETTIPSLLIPPSTTANLSAMLELKSGVGGSESSLFLSDLLRMYLRLANVRRWETAVVSQNVNEGGGIKDALVEVKGEGAYDVLRWESGVHRVQRVPATETHGRVHTSTVAVIVCFFSAFVVFHTRCYLVLGASSYGRDRYDGRAVFNGRC